MTYTPIQYMARLQVAAERARQSRRPVDPRVLSEISRLEMFARANFNPQQMAAAAQLVEREKLNVLETEQRQNWERTQQTAERKVTASVREMTHGLLGQPHGGTMEQVRAIARGEKLAPPTQKRETQVQRDARYRAATRNLDPRGKGWDEAETTRRMDAIADAKPGELTTMARAYEMPPERLRQTAMQWRGDRIAHGVERKRAERQLERERDQPRIAGPTEPTESDRRRAAIVSAYVDNTADSIEADTRRGRRSETFDDFNEPISPELFTEADGEGTLTRRAHVARAFAMSEQREQE